ncbi:hypothetical protein EMPS_07176 [Entomortierella parvispora]|uniref:Endoplasmic oxidoreductin n=1 Tax=Entomortierella parvispora TaxID=205924 RepID=A0A9P3HE33_9FUNG|nr:hypothetical protein EMPS_07176 [Entomortierella parvispora]
MSRMPNLCWAILVTLIAVLATGMFFGNPESSSVSWISPQPDSDMNDLLLHKQQPTQCNNPTGLIGDSSCCDYETVGKLNVDFSAKLAEVVSMPFFRYFKVNLYKECPFWNGAGLCMNRDCSVETMDKSKIPEKWKSHNLGKVSMPSSLNQPFGMIRPVKPTIKEQEFCVPEEFTDEVYVDLKDNPERFTGYSGPSAAIVWKAIYEENCFDVSKEMTAGCHYCESERKKLEEQQQRHKDHQHGKDEEAVEEMENNILVPPEPAPMKPHKPSKREMEEIFSRVPKGKGGLQQLIQDIADDRNPEESCLEKRVYYRLISGLHASISIHICDEWFNQTTGEWGPNLDCFISRVGMHPERLENIYFDYVVLLRAVTKISDYLAGYEFCTGDDNIDSNIMNVVNELVGLVKKCPPTFDEKLLFQGDHKGQVQKLKHQFRDHFRNVTRIMDCVGCEKCRLWGKVQTMGLGTALKLLFSYDEESLQGRKADGVLTRPEIVALLNTFNRFSESISAIERFGVMYQNRLDQEQAAQEKNGQDGSAQMPIRAPSKEEDDQDALVYKVLLTKIQTKAEAAYKVLDHVLESRNVTIHRTALKNLASWIR